MILDNSGIDYSIMILFVIGFLVYWKIETNSLYNLITKRSRQSCQKTKCDVKDNNFQGFITINNIFTPFFNSKITAIPFVGVIDYY